MKKLMAVVMLFLVVPAALALPAEGRVGPFPGATGTQQMIRLGTEGQTVISDLTARYYEAASRQQLFTVSTAVAGTTNAAANVTPPAAAAATILTLHNPMGSGKNLEVIKVYVNHISGTPAAGGIWLAGASNSVISVAQNATPVATFIGGGTNSVARGYTQTALTGGLVHTTIRPVANCSPFAGAIAATTVGLNCLDEVEGAIVVPPGGLLSVASSGTGTTHILSASIAYREAPLP